MQKGKERVYKGHGLTLYHQNFPKKQLQKHSHKEAHIFIPIEGSVELEVDDVVYKVNAGQMMFIGGSVEHNFKAQGESGERLIFQIEKFKYSKRVSILPVHHLIKDLGMGLFQDGEEKYSQSIVKLISEILAAVLDKEISDAKNELFKTQQLILTCRNPQLKKVLSLLESDLEISMAEVAGECGLSPRTLSRLTSTEMGLSPNELHTFYRIQKATELIYQGELSLTQIAFECGYSSLSQFIQNFKRWTGSKPSEFKPFQ